MWYFPVIALPQSSRESLYLACKEDLICNILCRNQKMQIFFCQVFPWDSSPSFFTTPENCSLLQNSLFSKRWCLTRACFSQGWISSSLGNSSANLYCRFYKNSGFGSQTFISVFLSDQDSLEFCAGGVPTMFRIWTDINRKNWDGWLLGLLGKAS